MTKSSPEADLAPEPGVSPKRGRGHGAWRAQGFQCYTSTACLLLGLSCSSKLRLSCHPVLLFQEPPQLCLVESELDAGHAGLLFQSSPAKEPCLHQVFAQSSPPWEVPILQSCGQLANNLLPNLSKSQAIVNEHTRAC